LNRLERWLLRRFLKKTARVLIGSTMDTHEPVITLMETDDLFGDKTSLWLRKSKRDDSLTIRVVTPY
jgi:hypothetical protein